MPIMRPHVHQPYGRYSICKDIAVCLTGTFSGSQTWATRNGPGRVHFRRPASDLSTPSSLVVTRRSAQWRSKPRRPLLARVLASLTFLMPVRTPRQLVLAPRALHPGAMVALLACRTSAGVGWTAPDARAAASDLVRGAADASSGLGSMTVRGGQPMVGRRGSVICATPFWGAGCGSSTTCTARAMGTSAAGARAPGAALAPSASSSRAPQALAAWLEW